MCESLFTLLILEDRCSLERNQLGLARLTVNTTMCSIPEQCIRLAKNKPDEIFSPPDVSLLLGQRRSRWANIKLTLGSAFRGFLQEGGCVMSDQEVQHDRGILFFQDG